GTKQPVIEPGKSDTSILVQRVTTEDGDKRMPLSATPLSPETVALIRHWIDNGAKEGKNPDDHALAVATHPIKRTRKLDVTLPTTAVPPKELVMPNNPGKLDLALKVGPLAPVAAVAFSPDGKLLAAGSYR